MNKFPLVVWLGPTSATCMTGPNSRQKCAFMHDDLCRTASLFLSSPHQVGEARPSRCRPTMKKIWQTPYKTSRRASLYARPLRNGGFHTPRSNTARMAAYQLVESSLLNDLPQHRRRGFVNGFWPKKASVSRLGHLPFVW